MKKFLVLFLLFAFVPMSYADPRIEVNQDNTFAHFILDADDTDNEVFMGSLDVVGITVVNNKANGFARFFSFDKDVGRTLVPGSENQRKYSFTYEDTGVPCTIVDSNGTEYRSTDYISVVYVKKSYTNMKLKCFNGVQD